MNIREAITRGTASSAHMLKKAVEALPEDKQDWSPGGKARTALSIMGECAAFPTWVINSIAKGGMEDFESADMVAIAAKTTDIKSALEVFDAETARFIEFVNTYPEDKMGDIVTFPWEAGPVAQIMSYHEWNNTYHLGQINQMQLILGDEEMHM